MVQKIGLMGGTFDPPHIGHTILAEGARLSLNLDKVWWMPNQIPPHKEKKSDTSDEERIEMVERVCEMSSSFTCNLIEFERKGPSYTVDTLLALKKRYANVEFYFIIGGDSVDTLHTWHEINTIKELVTFAWMKRPGSSGVPKVNVNMVSIESPPVDISSSYIRESIKNGTFNSFFVPDCVASYIKENKLYE
ncbi:nicotinate-nucleotide adenylyltransferase [Alteribacter aurantiacus]|uniref:nicotinate-nucleotide adenylyltransferase n=1 Tax=Alteribacter aurantiacus TaxID=254410 RepID=UPI0004061FCE|nr:nicotinate-nucleotide adenylyltransferase [Alteribacter aurantiacus]